MCLRLEASVISHASVSTHFTSQETLHKSLVLAYGVMTAGDG